MRKIYRNNTNQAIYSIDTNASAAAACTSLENLSPILMVHTIGRNSSLC